MSAVRFALQNAAAFAVLVVLTTSLIPATGYAASPHTLSHIQKLSYISQPSEVLTPGVNKSLVAVSIPAVRPGDRAGDTLSFDRALTRALEGSPRLRAAELEVEARQALTRHAGRLPNPIFDTEAENVAASGPDNAVVTATVGQRLELGGDRAARRRLAARDADVAANEVSVRRLGITALTRTRYAEASAAQARLRLAEEVVELAQAVLAATTEQVDAGDRSPVDQTRTEVALLEAEIDAGQAEAARLAAFSRLAALWNEAPDFDAVAALPPPEAVPPFDVLAEHLARSVALAVWDVEAERRAAVVRLETARRIPDLTLSAGYRRFTESGDMAFVGGLSIPLPVFNRNGGAVAAARARLRAAEAESESALVESRADLAGAHGELAAAYAEASTLRTEVLPRAADVAARIEEGYRAGKFSLLDVLDIQRTLAAARARYADALVAYHTAAADVDRLTTRPIDLTE
jgi:cobalt-zinc-cadmium efflux system outer membrane protein